jgi:hypothetical protein
MKRRKLIVGAGAIATGGAAALGTGAFSSVEADRQMSVELNDDTEAYLVAQPLDQDGNLVEEGPEPNAQDTPYAVINEEGRLVLTFDSLNPDAETVVNEVFHVANEGTQEIGVFFEKEGSNTGAVEFYANNGELNIDDERLDVSEGGAIRIGVGESFNIDVEFDTHGISSEDSIMDTLVINGDAEAGTQ